MKTERVTLTLTKITSIYLAEGAGDVLTYNQMDVFKRMREQFSFSAVGISTSQMDGAQWAKGRIYRTAESYGVPADQLRFDVAFAVLESGTFIHSHESIYFGERWTTLSVSHQ